MIKVKKCTTCKKEKDLSEFYRDSSRKDGRSNKCKPCKKNMDKEYIKKNKGKVAKMKKNYYEKNKESIVEYQKKWREDNKEYVIEYNKKWREENKEYLLERKCEYVRKRCMVDSLFRLKKNIRSLIGLSISNKGYSKSSRTHEILGCDYETLMNHLNDNPYGFFFGDEEIELDVDHIIPVSSVKTEEELLNLNHYTNLQLLPSYYNRYIKKDNEFNREHFEDWLTKNPSF